MKTQELQSFDSIAVKALSLSAHERTKLVEALLSSLEEMPPLSEEEQLEIVSERIRKYEAGEMGSRPLEEVMEELRQKYGL